MNRMPFEWMMDQWMDGSSEEVHKKGRGDGDGRRVLVAGAVRASPWWKSTVN